MDQSEFDKFAEEYLDIQARNVRLSGENPDFFFEYKISDISRKLPGNFEPKAMLDFGAGVGNSIPYVEKYFPDASLTCLDISDKSLEVAEMRFGDKAGYMPYDGSRISAEDNHFDVSYATCVFHHIPQNEHVGALEELRRVTRPDGYVFVFEHNPLNPLTVHTVNNCPFDENAVLISGSTMVGKLREAGFADVQLHYRLFFPNFLRKLRVIESALTWLPLGAQYYVCARKT